MAQILNFAKKNKPAPVGNDEALARFVDGYSIEVLPKTAAKIEDFRTILPSGTRVYVAHIDGTDINDMTATAGRLVDEGFEVMPHFPARSITSKSELSGWIAKYRDVGVDQALLIAGGIAKPRGEFDSSMQLIETGLFDAGGFSRLHVAGHPEGNKDIDPDGSENTVMYAIGWKAEFAKRTDATVAVATQFCFEAEPVIDWANRLTEAGIDLPVHIGVSGPAKLQTLIKFSLISGVGASVRVLQKRARDLTKLILPFEPTEFLTDLAQHKAANPDFLIENVHFFPFGGITKTADYANGFATEAARAGA